MFALSFLSVEVLIIEGLVFYLFLHHILKIIRRPEGGGAPPRDWEFSWSVHMRTKPPAPPDAPRALPGRSPRPGRILDLGP